MDALRWWEHDTPYGTVTVVTSPRGIRAIGLPGEKLEELRSAGDPQPDTPVAQALDAWFDGRGDTLDVPVDLEPRIRGFRRDVLDRLHGDVGWGETVTYGELAGMVGHPGAARAVGQVMATNPVPFVIPCHRVIAAGGRIGGYGGVRGDTVWVDLKRELLAREGVFPRP